MRINSFFFLSVKICVISQYRLYGQESFPVARQGDSEGLCPGIPKRERRYAVEYVEKNCNPELLPAWIESYLLRGHENRHRFRIFSAINTFDHDMALNELKKQAADWSFYDSSYVNELLEYLPRQKKGLERDFALIDSPESTTKQIQSEISRFRNKPIAKAIEPLLNIIKNESQEEELRILAAETLGWYNLYYNKADIIKELNTFRTSNQKLMNEVTKTINRLKSQNR